MQKGVNVYVETDVDRVVDHARRLVLDHAEAAALSGGARQTAKEQFGIERQVVNVLLALMAGQ